MYYSTFTINNQLYAFELGYVQEYAESMVFTRLPLPEESIIGIANLRGQIVTVLDLKHRLLGDFQVTKDIDLQYIVIRGNDSIAKIKIEFEKKPTTKEPIALMVDQRGGVMEIEKSSLMPSSSHGDDSYKNFVCNMVELEDEILLILDIQKVLGIEKDQNNEEDE